MNPRAPSIRFSLIALVLLLTVTVPLTANHPPTRPVSIGVISQFDQYLARNANLGWTRLDIYWRDIQPTSGAWNIGGTNSRINTALANGQQVLAILHVTPQWLTPDGDIPPYSTTEWSAFVRRLAFEMRGRIAAYEIWNEPDQKNTDPSSAPGHDGIGWGRNVEEPPLYIDFLHAATVEVHSQAPGTLVVGPAFMSRNNADGADNRKRRILQQAEATFYPDGQGSNFFDVISVHNNAGSTEVPDTMGWRLNYENLAYVWNHAPSARHRTIWVTEYGWRTNAVGDTNQRAYTCGVTQSYTGIRNPSYTHLNDWDVRRAFIFTDWDPNNNISNTIYWSNGTPKKVVTEYLQFLPYPAVQQASFSPNCLSATGLAAVEASTLRAALTDLGLRDPAAALPSGFKETAMSRDPEGLTTQVLFGDDREGRISVDVVPARDAQRGFLTESGAEWTSGDQRISISGLRDDGVPIGKSAVRSIAAALDASFGGACLAETIRDENAAERLGYASPNAPAGFAAKAAEVEYTHLTLGCGADVAKHTPDLDFTWTFENAAGEVIRAGIYRYGQSFEGTHSGERSLHWKGTGDARYWVAFDASVKNPNRATLRAIAESMDPAFGKAEREGKVDRQR